MTLYDYRENEIEAMREIARRRKRGIIEAIVCIPITAVALLIWIFI